MTKTKPERVIIDPEFRALILPQHAWELAELEANLLREGCREPLVIWSETGILLDGHHRRDICERHALPYQTVTVSLEDRDAAIGWMIKNQLGRRNMSRFGRADLVARLEPALVAAAKARQKQGGRGGAAQTKLTTRARNNTATLADLYRLPEGPGAAAGRTRAMLADVAGVSEGTMQKVLDLRAWKGKAGAHVRRGLLLGDLSIDAGFQEYRSWSAHRRRDARNAEIEQHNEDLPADERLYKVIYADPPWKYKARANHETKFRGGADGHYPLMDTNAIRCLPVSQLAADDCALFLWATWPMLDDALLVMACWGFRYVTAAFLWVKTNPTAKTPFFGTGYYTKSNSEPCLLGVCGKMPPVSDAVSQVILDERREHSRKPDEARTRIEKLYGDCPRIELFARQPVKGWEVWGNQAGKKAGR